MNSKSFRIRYLVFAVKSISKAHKVRYKIIIPIIKSPFSCFYELVHHIASIFMFINGNSTCLKKKLQIIYICFLDRSFRNINILIILIIPFSLLGYWSIILPIIYYNHIFMAIFINRDDIREM